MQRVGKRLTARRASPGMAFALAKRRNTAGGRFPARSRALAAKSARSSGCEHPPDAWSRLAQRERPRGSNPALQSLKRATAILCGLRLGLNPLGRSASVIITWIEY